MVKVELQISKNFSNDGPILHWHVHSHQQYHGDEIHAHDLGQEKDQKIGTFRTGDPYKEFGHGQQQASCGADDNESNQHKRYMLRPKNDVNVQPEPMNCNQKYHFQKLCTMECQCNIPAISMPLVIGSTRPTRLKTMLTVLMKIFQVQ